MIGRPDEVAGRLGPCQFRGVAAAYDQPCVTPRLNHERIDARAGTKAGDHRRRRSKTNVLGSETVTLLCAGCGAGLDGFRPRHPLDTASQPGSWLP